MVDDPRCTECVAAVVKTPQLLISADPRGRSPAWELGIDGFRHWVRDGAPVCKAVDR